MKMRRLHQWALLAVSSSLAVGLALGCSGDDSSPAALPDGGGDVGTTTDAPSGDAPVDSPATQSITFSYHPQWGSVTKVEVVGGFGQANDWSDTASFLTLNDDGSGTWTGTTTLPAGTYLYVFRVTGDEAAADAGVFSRYAIDPASAAYAACPMQSPTFDKNAPNPCSQATVPVGAASPPYHVKGVVHVDGVPAGRYHVVVERDEASSHHFFANRSTTAADGAFDLVVTSGSWRLQILHPSYFDKNDLQRDPIAAQALRRSISASIPLTADVTVATPDLSFHDYGLFQPRTDAGQTLPTVFTFGPGPQRLDIYDGPREIGDPWYASGLTDAGTAAFDGAFDTKQANEAGVSPGVRYFWGTERPENPDGGPKWTSQTMVFPIVWQ